MSEEYKIPRRQVMAQVTLVSEPPRMRSSLISGVKRLRVAYRLV
jgi:hypothetical protein